MLQMRSLIDTRVSLEQAQEISQRTPSQATSASTNAQPVINQREVEAFDFRNMKFEIG